MRRGLAYLALVLAAGLAALLWFVSTEEVDPAATEPGAYDFFLLVYTVTAMSGALLLCLVAEIAIRLARRRARSSA